MKKKATSNPEKNASLVHFIVRNHMNGERERIYILGCSTHFETATHIFQDAVTLLTDDPISSLQTIGLWKRVFIRDSATIQIRILSVPHNDYLSFNLNTRIL